MGAILTSDHIVNAVTSAGGFLNGFTYFTNPLSCAIGHAVLQEMLECDLITNAAERGEELKEALEALKAQWGYIGDVRGKGLLLALELVADQEINVFSFLKSIKIFIFNSSFNLLISFKELINLILYLLSIFFFIGLFLFDKCGVLNLVLNAKKFTLFLYIL